jgi:hypothetical protein
MNLGTSWKACARQQGSPLEEGVEHEAGEGGLAAVPCPTHRHDGRRHGYASATSSHSRCLSAASSGPMMPPLKQLRLVSMASRSLPLVHSSRQDFKSHWKEVSRGTRRRGVEVLVGSTAGRAASSVLNVRDGQAHESMPEAGGMVCISASGPAGEEEWLIPYLVLSMVDW